MLTRPSRTPAGSAIRLGRRCLIVASFTIAAVGCGSDDDVDGANDADPGVVDDTASIDDGQEVADEPAATVDPRDTGDIGQEAPETADTATDDPGAPADTAGTGADDPGAPADEPTGVISVGSQTFEVAGRSLEIVDGEFVDGGGDFAICEAVNPAFEGDANIIVELPDSDEFTFRINDGEVTVVFGELFVDEEETNDVEFERDGRTITGSAELPTQGTIEFELNC